jgi:hypothetical protein
LSQPGAHGVDFGVSEVGARHAVMLKEGLFAASALFTTI